MSYISTENGAEILENNCFLARHFKLIIVIAAPYPDPKKFTKDVYLKSKTFKTSILNTEQKGSLFLTQQFSISTQQSFNFHCRTEQYVNTNQFTTILPISFRSTDFGPAEKFVSI